VIFDQLAGVVERFLPRFLPQMHRAAVFEFPGRAHELLTKTPPTPDEVQFMQDTFFLPFPVTAVEDATSCVLLWDMDGNDDAQGFANRRFGWINANPVMPRSVDDYPESERPALLAEMGNIRRCVAQFRDPLMIVTWGVVSSFAYDAELHRYYAGNLSGCLAATPRELVRDESYFRGELDQFGDRCLRNPATAIEETAWFNMPNRFVLRTTRLRARRSPNPGRIARTEDRPLYTLLTPHAIRERLGLAVPTGRHPVAHPRRRHYRCLRDAAFVHKQGQIITIPATWVGPSEVVVGGHHYKVMLDL
jgi:hypothetical protein